MKTLANLTLGALFISASLNVAQAADFTAPVKITGDTGINETGSDAKQLVIQSKDANPKSLELGYQTKADYGSIQAIQQEVALKPLVLNPAGGNVGIGTTSPSYRLDVNGDARVIGTAHVQVLVVDGADIAEPFDIFGASQPKPGMVLSIDPEHEGQLRVSSSAYDTTVAGILSGAGGVNPGMLLEKKGTAASGKHPIALTGRVYCYADADAAGPIRPGDMLTTSATPGHAMKAANRERAGGAILGKAMSKLETGKGLVLVLVNLQ